MENCVKDFIADPVSNVAHVWFEMRNGMYICLDLDISDIEELPLEPDGKPFPCVLTLTGRPMNPDPEALYKFLKTILSFNSSTKQQEG